MKPRTASYLRTPIMVLLRSVYVFRALTGTLLRGGFGDVDWTGVVVIRILSIFLLIVAGFGAWAWLPRVDAGKWTLLLVLRYYAVICLWFTAFFAFIFLPGGEDLIGGAPFDSRVEALAMSLAGPLPSIRFQWTYNVTQEFMRPLVCGALTVLMLAVGLKWPNYRFARVCGYVGVFLWFVQGFGFIASGI